jgi:EpsI family protein
MKPIFDNFTEPQADRRKFLLGALLASACGISAWRAPRTIVDQLGRQKLEDIVPKTIGPWNFVTNSGLVVPPNDPLLNQLYSQQLTRVYSDEKSPPIMLLMAQNGTQTGFLQVHRPEFCYRAGGYKISSLAPHPISVGPRIIPAIWMEAVADSFTEHVVYWIRIGDTIPTSWSRQKIAVAEQNFRGIVPDAILIRVSTIGADAASGIANIDAFVRAMLESIPQSRRSVFVV